MSIRTPLHHEVRSLLVVGDTAGLIINPCLNQLFWSGLWRSGLRETVVHCTDPMGQRACDIAQSTPQASVRPSNQFWRVKAKLHTSQEGAAHDDRYGEVAGAAKSAAHSDAQFVKLPLPPPAVEVAADWAPDNEFPVTFDDAVPSGARVKLRLLHR